MRRFTFSLESVLSLRRQEQQTQQVALASLVRDRASVVDQIAVSRAAEADMYEYMRSGQLTGAQLAHVAQYGTLHRQRIFEMTVRLRQFDQAVESARGRLQVARTKCEALEKLREKQLTAHRAAELAEAARELDDISQMRAARSRSVMAG